MIVGFIGLGTMGSNAARNVRRAGFEMVVHDIRPEAVERQMEPGVTAGSSPADVLARADVSMAVGPSVPLAQAQADLVMPSAPLLRIGDLLQQSKRTMQVVRQNLLWALIYNMLCVPLALTGSLPAWLAGLGMALSSLLVVLNAARLARSPHALST